MFVYKKTMFNFVQTTWFLVHPELGPAQSTESLVKEHKSGRRATETGERHKQRESRREREREIQEFVRTGHGRYEEERVSDNA